MVRVLCLLSVPAFLTSCGQASVAVEPAQQTTETKQNSIINGVKITTLPAVGSIVLRNTSEVYCTATLIAPRKILTAAHCIDSSESLDFVTGATTSTVTNRYKITAQKGHPSYKGDAYDVGIMTLEKDALETPMQLNTTMDASWVGRAIYWVGYGDTNGNGGGSGSKRAVTIPISAVDPLTFDFESTTYNTCFGDSGGPGFYIDGAGNYTIVGLTSWGDEFCAEFGVNTRVDALLSWIQTNAGLPVTAPVCSADGQCNQACTTTVDPDCVVTPVDDCAANNVCAAEVCATPDPDCTAVGEACTAGSVCASRLCVGDPQHTGKYCSEACTSSSDCPSDMECSSTKACIFKQVPTKDVGEACTKTDLCATGTLCAVGVCSLICKADSDCNEGEVCQSVSGAKKACIAVPPTVDAQTTGALGATGSTGSATAPKASTSTTPTAAAGCSANGEGSFSAFLLTAAACLFARRRRG
jgi:secreted trypsin-like serine protease